MHAAVVVVLLLVVVGRWGWLCWFVVRRGVDRNRRMTGSGGGFRPFSPYVCSLKIRKSLSSL